TVVVVRQTGDGQVVLVLDGYPGTGGRHVALKIVAAFGQRECTRAGIEGRGTRTSRLRDAGAARLTDPLGIDRGRTGAHTASIEARGAIDSQGSALRDVAS